MIYFTIAKEKEWEILEHWNMSVVATIHHNENLANRIVRLLNEEDKERERQHWMKRFDPKI